MDNNVVLGSLLKVQQELHAPKNLRNDFGKYNYRSAEAIFEAAKPLCHANGLVLSVSDEISLVGDRYYVRATASVLDAVTGAKYEVVAYAREDDSKKGMDGSQLTGACSSYARKYALCGLFAIDDNRDADTNEYQQIMTAKPTAKLNDAERIRKGADELDLTENDLNDIAKAIYKKDSFKALTDKQLAHFAANFDKVLDKFAEGQGT